MKALRFLSAVTLTLALALPLTASAGDYGYGGGSRSGRSHSSGGGSDYGYGYTNPESHNVRGYTRRDGTYVEPHRATNPNSTERDNYSTKGNTNPWTGEQGDTNVDK